MAIVGMAYVHARYRCRQVGHFGRAAGTVKTADKVLWTGLIGTQERGLSANL